MDLRPLNKSIWRGESDSFGHIFVSASLKYIFWKKRPKIHFTKVYPKYLDFPCRELSNGGLGIIVTLLFFSEIDFVCVYIGDPIQLYILVVSIVTPVSTISGTEHQYCTIYSRNIVCSLLWFKGWFCLHQKGDYIQYFPKVVSTTQKYITQRTRQTKITKQLKRGLVTNTK